MTPELAALATGALAGWASAGLPKAQAVRLLDVWALGPLMVYVALQAADAGALARLALLAAGAATVTYNGRNYLRARASGQGWPESALSRPTSAKSASDPMAPLGA